MAAALLCAASGDFNFLVCEGPKERVFGASVIEGEGAWLAGSCETVRRYFSMRSRPPLVLTHLFFPSGETIQPSRGSVVTPGDKGAFVAIIELLCYQSIGSLDKEEEGAQSKQRRNARSMMHNPQARSNSNSRTG